MTERGLPTVDGSPACPFVAFEDDRDERSTSPDHRHRCFAEDGPPAPRAAAHQEAYCLSSAFPVCPTFQAWARREAARAKTTEPTDRERGQRTMAGLSGADEWARPAEAHDRVDAGEAQPRRNPPRDWAAPPPWAPGGTGAGGPAVGGGAGAVGGVAGRGGLGGPSEPAPPTFLGRQPDAGQGLAGSAADRLAGGGSSSLDSRAAPSHPNDPMDVSPVAQPGGRTSAAPVRSSPPDPDLAALVGRGSASSRPPAGPYEDDDIESVLPPRPARRQAVSSTRSDRGRDAARPPHREHVQGPSWERARRNEAYPTIRTRAGLGGLPGLPRVAVLFGALVIAAVALFFLPALLGVGGPDDPAATASPSASLAAPTATPEPTPVPEPTPQTYTIQEGDFLSVVADRFGVTLDELLAANPDIEDPNRISVGDVIIIPVAPPDEIPDGGASAEPTG